MADEPGSPPAPVSEDAAADSPSATDGGNGVATSTAVSTPAPTPALAESGDIPPTSTPVEIPTRRPARPTSNPAPIGAAVAKVNISSLALRRFPLEDAPTIGAIREGDEYTVSALSRDGKWVRLETPLDIGGRGWVAARFVSVFGEITGILITDGLELGYTNVALASNQAVANTGERRLRLRSGPGSSFDTVFFAFNGELFTVIEESGTWVHLSNPSMNVDGWAARRFLRLASDPIPTARPSPTSTPTVLLSPPTARATVAKPTATPNLATSTPTTVPTRTATRLPIAGATPSDSGFVTSTPVPIPTRIIPTRTTPVPLSDSPTVTSNGPRVTIVTDGSRLRVRSAPNTESEIVAHVFNDEVYAVIEESADGVWTRIGLDDGASGWVSTRFTRDVDEAAP